MTKMIWSIMSASSLLIMVTACSVPDYTATAMNDHTPGWTGRTLIPGNTSTVAGDAAATNSQQKWPFDISN